MPVSTRIPTASFQRSLLWFAVVGGVALAPMGLAQTQGPVADELARLGTDTSVTRTMALSGLGISDPIVLQARENHRDLYLPVPADIPLSDASIRFDAGYALPEAARTTLVLSLDNDMVSARSLTQERGDAGIELGVDGSPRPGGFVQLGVQWTSISAASRCGNVNAPANVLRILPGTQFFYRYDSAAIRDLPTAWTALPPAPVILTAGNALSLQSYDAAWRMGVALERSGKRPVVLALPQAGDEIDLRGIAVPAGLRAIPAFDALAQGGRRKIESAAEVGALIALGADGPLHADIMVADQTLLERLADAVNALRDQVLSAAPQAAEAFAQWQKRTIAPLLLPPGKEEVRLAFAGGRPVIVLGADAGAKAASLLDNARHRTLLSPEPGNNASAAATAAVPIARLGGNPGSFDVGARGEWQASFDLADVAHGRTPAQAVLDLAAAPVASFNSVSAAVFMNDVLLGSRRIAANGKVERLSVGIPHYAVSSKNTLRVVFQRPSITGDCNEAAMAAPVSVLPTSHVLFEKMESGDDFIGMRTRFSAGASVFVPRSYLNDATASLARVIRIADVAGVSPMHAMLTLNDSKPLQPQEPFLAFDVPATPAREKVRVDAGRVILASYGERKPLDASGAARLGVVEVNRVGNQAGMLYHSVGNDSLQFDKPFMLAHGDVAILAPGGVLAEVDTDGSMDARLIAEGGPAWWRRALTWLAPVAVVMSFVGLLVAASHMRRRKEAAAKAKDAA